jgi:hypothetical protein
MRWFFLVLAVAVAVAMVAIKPRGETFSEPPFELFPDMDVELRSRPTSKNVRLGMADGVAEIEVRPKGERRQRVVRLPRPGAASRIPELTSAEWTPEIAQGLICVLRRFIDAAANAQSDVRRAPRAGSRARRGAGITRARHTS